MSTINVKDAAGNTVAVNTPNADGPLPSAESRSVVLASDHEKVLIGSAKDRFFDNFADFDTVDTWELVQTGPGMAITGPLGGAVAGSSPYLNIASGTTVGQTIILSRDMFRPPIDLKYQLTASQRIANTTFRIGFLECNSVTGAIVESTVFATAPEVLNARNAVMQTSTGTTATTNSLAVRVAGSALDTFANAHGTGYTTVATGSTPNFIAPTTYGLSFERDKISTRAWVRNALTNLGGQFAYDRLIPNPTRTYRLAIIVENGPGVPASSTDWRLHVVNLLDGTRVDVAPRAAGRTDGSQAFPVWVSNTPAVTVTGTLTTVTTVTNVTNAGTPTAPATPYILNSLASTNEAIILTGSSGLQAFYATNAGASVAFVKLYNKATTAPTSADTPAMIIPVPAAAGGVPGVATLPIGFSGFRFALGLGIRITGLVDDADATAVAAGQVKVMLSRTI